MMFQKDKLDFWVALLAPSIAGAAFVAIVVLERVVLDGSYTSARIAIVAELLSLLICIFVIFVSFTLAIRGLWLRRWFVLVGTAIGVALCLYLLGVGFERGAAIIYAT